MKNNKKPSNEDILKSIQINVAGMKLVLPEEISVGAFSIIAKIPHKVHSLREALFHRVFNLSEIALSLLKNNEFIPSLLLIRSVLECTAVMYYLDKNVRKCIQESAISDFDDKIMRMLLGSRDETTKVQAINILTIIDHWTKTDTIIRKMYDDLSEFTHTNWSGVEGSYGKIDKEKLIVTFRKNTSKNSWPYILAITVLDISLRYFIHYYDEIADFLKKFAELCEKEIEKEKEISKRKK